MLDRVQMYLNNRRTKAFQRRILKEIGRKIRPHLRGHANHGYPFNDDAELIKAGMAHFDEALNIMEQIHHITGRTADAHIEALFYVAGRDIKNQLVMYLQYAKKYENPPLQEPVTASCPAEVLA